jgi:hypothetical protein
MPTGANGDYLVRMIVFNDGNSSAQGGTVPTAFEI